MENRKVYISQKDNFAGAFGLVYRSSAIFYYKQTADFKTTISFMDYWRVKRGLDVMVVASIRELGGKLVKREQLNFQHGMVINYCELAGSGFEGSVELEIFSSKNMVIPYSAIMAIYEAPNSISMVHSYGRTYSPHEIEEGRTISVGEEGCWTVRDTASVRSIGVMHNGATAQPEQQAKMVVSNHRQETQTISFTIPAMGPYETYRVRPQAIFPGIVAFLAGHAGNVSLSFDLKGSFSRMMVGNETVDGREFQVTHSNFNYRKHETDTAGDGAAYMYIPPVGFRDYKVIVYPDSSQGTYLLENGSPTVTQFNSGERVELPVKSGYLKLSKTTGLLPSRIVTALTAKPAADGAVLPFECSLGVAHKLQPLKSSFWGLVAIGNRYKSRLIMVSNDVLFGEVFDQGMTISLYTQGRKDPWQRRIGSDELKALSQGIYIADLFPETQGMDHSEFAYFYLKTDGYGGYICFSTLESMSGSLCLEHSF